MRSEAVTLAGRLHEARQERDELLHCARAASGAEDKTGMLVSLQHENVVLKKQLLAFQEARENAALWRTGRLGPSDHEVAVELGVIESSIADACASLHWDGWLLDRPKGEEEPRTADLMLSQWAYTLSSSASFSSFMASLRGRLPCKDGRRPPIARGRGAVCSRVAAAPRRNHGPGALHQIELLAYKSLTSQSHFDAHLVAGRSRTLSEYIYHVLEPLFREDPPPSKSVDGSSEADVVSSDAVGLLEDAVQRALQLAAKLYLTDRWCRWQFAQPGCSLDARTMRVAGQAAVHSSTEEPVVQLCIFPALYMSKAPKGPRTYERMEGAGTGGPEDLRDYKLVAQGLVIV
ncbi:hypothetical protein PG994_004096 [Apiospora phragmitis]|uniref:Uncharacterized protein n=1 Tax=Apiospora phragmitis TaxID=2905665 RepID=A0ABR1VPW9_9PEZI